MNVRPVVHIVDDDASMRKSVALLLESAGLSPAIYDSCETFLDAIKPDQPGCLVLDLRMKGMGGIELLQRLRAQGADIPVIIISGHADVPSAVRGMKLGAIDLLQKPFEPEKLLNTVRRALEVNALSHQRKSEDRTYRQRLADLTPRELDLLKLVVAGRSNKQIASDLHIAIKTVANHRANLMAKTGALNAADLARLSVLAGIQTPQNPA